MSQLYVAYSAKNPTNGASVTGWVVFNGRVPPNNADDVRKLCADIASGESVSNVIPLWWKWL